MRLTKEQKEQENIISDREMRDKCAGHYEVLEKVKELLLLPGTEMMSIEQVANYYEVSDRWIKELMVVTVKKLTLMELNCFQEDIITEVK